MTVAELIKLLQEVPPETIPVLEFEGTYYNVSTITPGKANDPYPSYDEYRNFTADTKEPTHIYIY